MTKLLYILSEGHSGSTLTDILSGTIPGVFSTGECVYLPWQLSRDGNVCELKQDICSCGQKFSQCETWRKIIGNLSQKVGYDIYKEPFRFRITILKNQTYGVKLKGLQRLERSVCSRIMRYRLSRPVAFFCQLISREEVRNSWLLFDGIGEDMNVSYVIDSSKDALRFRFLQAARPSDVKAIVLMRNVLGVAASVAKQGRDPVAAAKQWINYYDNILMSLRNTVGLSALFVEYEEVAENPEQVRARIARFIGLSSPKDEIAIDTNRMHLVAGNAMRYKGKIDIRYDDSWRNVLSFAHKKKISRYRSKIEVIEQGLRDLCLYEK